MPVTRRELIGGTAAAAVGVAAGVAIGIGVSGGDDGETPTPSNGGDQVNQIATARGLAPEDIIRAVKTYVPGGKRDEFYLFCSGGHGGQILVVGVPSMRLIKVLGLFTPEPWQGFGYGGYGDTVIANGTDPNKGASTTLKWADTHHPALSETNGEYDGRYVYINDRANGRIGMIDLRDFKAKQILDVPNLQTSHGGVFSTPNTEYVHISTMSPTLLDPKGAGTALENYAERFRGYSTFLAVDPATGRMDVSKSFQLELPPYTQDLADAGKLASFGWAFINSYNSEMATGGDTEGGKPIEVGASQNDFDYLHIINWKKAEEVVAAGKFEERNGMRVIPIQTSIDEGLLFLAPEPKSPHGVDIAPNGEYICIGGKLDQNATVYSITRILKAIETKDYEGNDQYGLPILKYDSVKEAQVLLGAGPLHTQFDDKGYAYTSMFIDSAVAKWSLGAPYHEGDTAWKLVDKVPVQYNIGHLVTMEGDTVKPKGKYLVALNKWSIDRYPVLGTLKPQNFQLVDLNTEKMEVLYDSPIGIGEPHYVQAIAADKIKAWEVYPAGTDALTLQAEANATAAGQERIEAAAGRVEVWGTLTRSHFTPDVIRAKKGDKLVLHLTNVETAPDATHGYAIPRYNVNLSLDAGESTTVELDLTVPGAFANYCTEFCSALHLEMQGWLIVEDA